MDIKGTKIYSDSLASSVRDDYQTLLAFGVSDEEAEKIILKGYENFIGTEYESIFWISFAYTQWRLGRLSKDIKDKVIEVIDSGEDLKKWKKVILLEPQLKANRSGLLFKSLTSIHEEETISDKTPSKIEKGMQEYYKQNIEEIVAFAKNMPEYKDVNTNDLIDLTEDAFTQSIHFINGSAKKKYESRKQELLTFKSQIDQNNPRKKVQKPEYNESLWKPGDCVAFKLENLDGDYKNLNGKWVAIRILRVVEKPLIDILPNLAHNDTITISFYDVITEKCPTKSDIMNADYMVLFNTDGHLHKGVWLSLYQQKRYLKNWEWVLVDSNPDFEKEDSLFFSEGVFQAIICGLNQLSEFFIHGLKEKQKSIEATKS